ncbi:MAG TPA: hypothetical protein VKS60_06400 [Stellaceae bacterium]|nr:hypothetical protein [Stellaceae bacterium]
MAITYVDLLKRHIGGFAALRLRERDELMQPRRKIVPVLLVCGLLFGLAVLGLYARTSDSPLKAFSITLIIGGGALLVGAFVGFLFGIPKSRTDGTAAAGDGGRKRGVSDNANLEEVSDWLTKIIVGLGLAEFGNIPQFCKYLSEIVTPVLGEDGNIIAQSAMVYFFILGFLLCYLWTRIDFYEWLTDRDRDLADALKEVENKVENVDRELAKAVQKVEINVEKLDREFQTNRILNDFYAAIDVAKRIPPEKRDWGVLKDLNRQALEILRENPLNRKASILTARFMSDIENNPLAPLGNEQAIRHLDIFLDAKRKAGELDKDYADVLYNRACHTVGIVQSRGTTPAGDPETLRLKKQAMRDLRDSVRLSPTNAKEATEDPDFSCLYDDPDFKRVVAEPAVQPTPDH